MPSGAISASRRRTSRRVSRRPPGACGSDPACPRSSLRPGPHGPCSCQLLHLGQIGAVAFRLHDVARDETERRRVDAIAQAAFVARPVIENVAEMAVAML